MEVVEMAEVMAVAATAVEMVEGEEAVTEGMGKAQAAKATAAAGAKQ